MTNLPLITIGLIRAEDIPDGSYVRRPITQFSAATEGWQWVYNVTPGGGKSGDGEPRTDTAADKLDERYVVMRLSVDPALSIPTRREAGETTQNLDRFTGVRAEYDDVLMVSRAYDLWEIQIKGESEGSDGNSMDERILAAVRDWSDEEFLLGFGFSREVEGT